MQNHKREPKRTHYTMDTIGNRFTVAVPKHRGLTLSGGGFKGIGYAGMIDAMDKRGFICDLTHVSGASAGAITASFLAIGVNNDNILKLIRELNIVNLLDYNSGTAIRAEGKRIQNVLELIYALQIKEHLKEVDISSSTEAFMVHHSLMQKVSRYDEVLKSKGITINSVDDIIKLSQSKELLKKLDVAFSSLFPKDSETLTATKITFNDLAQLRDVMPKEKQHLIKRLSVVATNQTQEKLEIYTEGDVSIAEKVQHSSAHPLLFASPKNNKGENISDGGILDNMPVGPLLDAGLHQEEILCVRIESGSLFEARVKKAKSNLPEEATGFSSALDYVAKHVLGGEIFKNRAETNNSEKYFYHIGNMLFIDVDEITTTSLYLTENQKNKAINNAFQQTNEWLDSLNKKFDHPLIAMLYLGLERLDKSLNTETPNNNLFRSAAHCKTITLLQTQVIKELNEAHFSGIFTSLKQIEDVLKLDAELNDEQIKQAMALCLKQIDFCTKGKLKKFVLEQSAQEQNETQLSWIRYILNLLVSAMEWILSCFIPNPENTLSHSQNSVENKVEKNLVLANKLNPLSVLGLFQYEAPPIYVEPKVEEDLFDFENIVIDLN